MDSKKFEDEIVALQSTLALFCKRFVTDEEESEDLIQETILKALTHRNKFKQNTNLNGWLYTIMRNTFINKYRQSQRARTFLDKTDDFYYLNVPDRHTTHNPESNFQYNELIDCINDIREVFLTPFKMHTEGYKYHEIADELNLPVGTVKNRIFHARKEIQKRLSENNTQFV